MLGMANVSEAFANLKLDGVDSDDWDTASDSSGESFDKNENHAGTPPLKLRGTI